MGKIKGGKGNKGRGQVGKKQRQKGRSLGRECLQTSKPLQFTEQFFLLFSFIIMEVPCLTSFGNDGK